MHARRRVLGPCLVALLAGGCAPGLPLVTKAQVDLASARWPGVSNADLRRGRRLYVDRCSSCHGLFKPDVRTDAEWDAALEKMATRARLSASEAEAIRRYLQSARQIVPESPAGR